MDSSGLNQVDIFEIYRRYCDIRSRNEHAGSKETLAQLLKMVELRGKTRSPVFHELSMLLLHLNPIVDSYHFTCFYDFVFFMCRENGQKSISVDKAICAWRLVLAGRFRLLNQWCDFVEKHRKHNISEDTWQQVLAFSRCVHEDLEGYDPKGAWPVLIDDFVEHMYSMNSNYSSGDPDPTMFPSDDTLPGLKVFSGSKRKFRMYCHRDEVLSSTNPSTVVDSMDSEDNNTLSSKRSREVTCIISNEPTLRRKSTRK